MDDKPFDDGQPKVILITGSGLGKTFLAKLLADQYRANNIPCRIIHYPGCPLAIGKKEKGFIIIDAVNTFEEDPKINALTPWLHYRLEGGLPQGPILSLFRLFPSSSECGCNNLRLSSDRNRHPFGESCPLLNLPCSHGFSNLSIEDTKFSLTPRSCNRSKRECRAKA